LKIGYVNNTEDSIAVKVYARSFINKQHLRFACDWCCYPTLDSQMVYRNLESLQPEKSSEKIIFWTCVENPKPQDEEMPYLMIAAISST
jgi:hypothetical protein